MHRVRIDPAARVITCVFTGMVCVQERCEAIDAVLAQVDATGFTRLLVDFIDATVAVEDVAQLNRLARRLANDPTLARCRVAYLRSPSSQWDPAVEMLAHGRGFHAERFAQRERALDWLS